MQKIKYYMFCIRWLWKNRTWDNTKQKFKKMNKDFEESRYMKDGKKRRRK